MGIALAIHFDELYEVKGDLFEDVGVKEERADVMGGKQLRFIGLDHRRQLVQVANKDHLHPAKRLAVSGTIHAEEFVDAIEKVRPHHADLVDDDGLQVAVELPFGGGAAAGFIHCNAGAEAEKGVNGLPLHIHRRHPGRGQHREAFTGDAAEML